MEICVQWRKKSLKEVIKFRITLFREQFSIYGFSNIMVFLICMFLFLGGGRFVLISLGNYRKISMLLCGIVFCFMSPLIFPKDINKKSQIIAMYFDKININEYKKYLTYCKYFWYQLGLVYLIFPYNRSDISFFIILFALMQLLLLMMILIFFYGNKKLMNSVSFVISSCLCVGMLWAQRSAISFQHEIFNNIYFVAIAIFIGTISVIYGLKNIGAMAEKKESVSWINMTSKISYIQKNKDILYIIRKNKLFEPLFVILISTIFSYFMKENEWDTIFTHLFSFSYLLSNIFIALMKYENRTFIMMYSSANMKDMKIEKIFNTIKISLSVFVMVFIPLILFTSFISVIVAFGISLLLFIINSFMIKFSIDKKNGYKYAILNGEEIKFMLYYTCEIIGVYIMGILLKI